VITVLAVENYRSLRRLVVGAGRLNVVTGANGSGKSSLYRALRLLADSARNGAVAALAREGGLESTLWAGPPRASRRSRQGRPLVDSRTEHRLLLGFAGDDFGYAMDLGLPPPAPPGLTMFGSDPEIKAESVWAGPVLRQAALLAERHATGTVRSRTAGGDWMRLPYNLRPFDSMLSEVADPQRAPELLALRERIRSWRFYDHLRTDAQAPARAAQVGTRTTVLSHDGADLAAALQTIREIGDDRAMDGAVDRAFPGSSIQIADAGGRFELRLRQPGLMRPLRAAEVSDGTLRYLLWVAALLTPRPPELLVLNEPETSLHPDMTGPLADLIIAASASTQVIVVTHAQPLVSALQDGSARTIKLIKDDGRTLVDGQGTLDEPAWHWPGR
jgi:predicted ATPase